MTITADFSPTRDLPRDYRLGSPIASGTFGKVCKAVKIETDSPVAIKTSTGVGAGQQLNLEITNLQTFQGLPHSLTLRHGISGNKPVVISDQIPGKDVLRTMIANPNAVMPFTEWVTIAKQLLEFLQGVHGRNWFHGDLKGDNVIYEKEVRHLTVLDYNGAGQEGQRPSSKVLQGAPFKAPEIILLGAAKKELDTWSAGCMLFTFLTGQNLFPVTFIPSPRDTSISDNQHLHMIVDMLGMPPSQFLAGCSKAQKYYQVDAVKGVSFLKPLRAVGFDEWKKIKAAYTASSQGKPVSDSLHTEMDKVYWKQEPWQTIIDRALDKRQVSPDEKQQVIELLSQMIRYENRVSATDLLISPLFKNDIHFHLTLPSDFGAKSTDKIAIHRACDVQIDKFPDNPSILIDRQIRVTRHCYHIPRDPSDRYFVVVQRGEEDILIKPLSISCNDRIILEESEGQIKLRRKSQDEAVEEIYQSTRSQKRERTPSATADQPAVVKKLKFDPDAPTEPEKDFRVPSTKAISSPEKDFVG